MTDSITPAAVPDTIDTVAGLRDGDAVAALRRARDKVLLHTQLSEAALFDPHCPIFRWSSGCMRHGMSRRSRTHTRWPTCIAPDCSTRAARPATSNRRIPTPSTRYPNALARSSRTRSA